MNDDNLLEEIGRMGSLKPQNSYPVTIVPRERFAKMKKDLAHANKRIERFMALAIWLIEEHWDFKNGWTGTRRNFIENELLAFRMKNVPGAKQALQDVLDSMDGDE